MMNQLIVCWRRILKPSWRLSSGNAVLCRRSVSTETDSPMIPSCKCAPGPKNLLKGKRMKFKILAADFFRGAAASALWAACFHCRN